MKDSIEKSLFGSDLKLPLVSRFASFRSQAASRITWHSHDCFEILLLLEGATAYEFSEKRTVELPGGHFMVIPPGTLHRGLHDVRRPVHLTGLMFDPSAAKAASNTPFTPQDLAWLKSQYLSRALRATRISPGLRDLLKSIPVDISGYDLTSVPLLLTLRFTVCAILLEAAKQLGAAEGAFEPKQTVQAAITYMKAHLSEEHSIHDVAKVVHCSRAKLFEVFKEETGMTPNDYWQRLRIDLAQEMLVNTNRSITQIAMDCGFSSSQYFSSVFRKYSGVSPTDYRQGLPLPIARSSSE